MSNPRDGDFFTEEKCAPMRRVAQTPKKPTNVLPKELKPKFPRQDETPPPPPILPSPAYPSPAVQTPPPVVPATPTTPEAQLAPTPTTPEGEGGDAGNAASKRKSCMVLDDNALKTPPQSEFSANQDETKTAENQEMGQKGEKEETIDAQEQKKRKKPKKAVTTKKKSENTAVAVFMDEDFEVFPKPDNKAAGKKKDGPPAPGQVQFIDDDDDDVGKKNKKDKGGKKGAAPVQPGQVQFIDDDDDDKKKKSERTTKKKDKKAGGKADRPGSIRQKKHVLPAAFTAFASPGGPVAQGSVYQKKEQGSVRNKPTKGHQRGSHRASVRAHRAHTPSPSTQRAREPNEGFFKAMYSKAKNKIAVMSKNPQASSASTSNSSASMSSSDDALIATDANMNLKNDVAVVYGTAADYPRGVIPAKHDKNHPDKLFPAGRPYWLTRDEKPPEAKVILMSLVDQCLRDGSLQLVEPQEKPKELTPYADDAKGLKAKDEEYVLDGSRILANTVYNTCYMKALAVGELKKGKKPLEKPRPGRHRIIHPTQSAIYTRKQQKQKKFSRFVYKSAAGTEAHRMITKKKKTSSNTTIEN